MPVLRSVLSRSFSIGLLWLAGSFASVQAQAPLPPEIAARSYLLLDMTSSR